MKDIIYIDHENERKITGEWKGYLSVSTDFLTGQINVRQLKKPIKMQIRNDIKCGKTKGHIEVGSHWINWKCSPRVTLCDTPVQSICGLSEMSKGNIIAELFQGESEGHVTEVVRMYYSVSIDPNKCILKNHTIHGTYSVFVSCRELDVLNIDEEYPFSYDGKPHFHWFPQHSTLNWMIREAIDDAMASLGAASILNHREQPCWAIVKVNYQNEFINMESNTTAKPHIELIKIILTSYQDAVNYKETIEKLAAAHQKRQHLTNSIYFDIIETTRQELIG